MLELNEIAIFMQRLNEIGVNYMICGPVASIFYGEPRMTHDVDLVLEVSTLDIDAFVKKFPLDEFYCPPPEVIIIESKRDVRGHCNIIHHDSGFKADIYFTGREPVQFWGMQNRVKAVIDEIDYWFAAPEYVIVKKLEFYKEGKSEKHIRDIQTMFELSGDDIDRESVKKYASLLGVSDLLKKIF